MSHYDHLYAVESRFKSNNNTAAKKNTSTNISSDFHKLVVIFLKMMLSTDITEQSRINKNTNVYNAEMVKMRFNVAVLTYANRFVEHNLNGRNHLSKYHKGQNQIYQK